MFVDEFGNVANCVEFRFENIVIWKCYVILSFKSHNHFYYVDTVGTKVQHRFKQSATAY